MYKIWNISAFKKNIVVIFFILLSITIVSCMVREYYSIKPFDICYDEMEEVFSRIENNALITFIVAGGSCDMYIVMRIKDAQQYKTLNIKEIGCQVNNSKIVLLKDRNYKIDYEHITLGKIKNINVKELLRNIGKNNIELPIIYEYILDDGDLIHEEYIYLFKYEKDTVFFWDK